MATGSACVTRWVWLGPVTPALACRPATTPLKGVVHPEHARRMHALPRLSLNGDYQERRMLEALLSGLPFALARPIRSLGID